MNNKRRSRFRLSASLLCCILCTAPALSAPAVETRNALLDIVTDCLDVNAPDYCARCSWPRTDSLCGRGRGCRETTEVWEETNEFVVIRDRKMCGCPEGFMHGLALPRRNVSGIEDANRPDGIWQVAWNAARKRIEEEDAIALAVNPQGKREQDQLHVHIVRLLPDARRSFDRARLSQVSSLDRVWSAAAGKAASLKRADYGVLVAKDPAGGFLVLVEEQSPEKLFTRGECR